MPINSTIDYDRKLISTDCTGLISMSDFHYYLDDFLSKNDLKGCNEIFDTTKADWSNIGYMDLMEISKRSGEIETIDSNTKFAWVVGGVGVETLIEFYKSTKMLQESKTRVLRAFNNYKDALNWLNS